MAEVLQAATGDPAGRAGYLVRLYERGDARVRESVLTAAVMVDDPTATRLVLRGLQERDLGVVTSALEAAAAQPGRILGLANRAAVAAPEAAPALPARAPRPSPEVCAALASAHSTLAATDDLEGLQAWLDAVAVLRDPTLVPRVRALAVHPNVTLRDKARETLEKLGEPASETPPSAITNALAAGQLPRGGERISALLTLASGDVEIELLTAEAPTTVAHFVALAERGFYDGLRLHRVVPGFVVQGGDPRGDGYGGPGYSQRCEDNRVRYVRGTVGMALAGRDTGGSQFFITQAAQPHLDGRYTAFGRVVRGMDLVDRVLPNDVITRVKITRPM
jgi:cyclophilin family peptidyl-prolyl cis-trans isomerase